MREGPLHAAVKAALAEPDDRLEVPVGRFVIDLVRADGELVEVQTGGFGALGNKLDALFDEHRIRIVYPVAAERRIVRVDEHGQVLGVRRWPKRATAVAVFDKLVAFPSLLTIRTSRSRCYCCVRITSAARSRRPLAGAAAIRASGGWSRCSTGSR